MHATHRLLFAVAVCAAVLPAQGKPLAEDRRQGAAAVDVAQCKKWLFTLASPEFGGRGTGQDGFQKAADFVAEHFKSLGLEPRGDDKTFFQYVPWGGVRVDAENSYLSVQKGGAEVLRIPAGRIAGTVSAGVDAKGDLVLLALPMPEGRGAAASIPGLDEVAVDGKVVVVWMQTDGAESSNQTRLLRYTALSALTAKHAAAVVFAQVEATTGGLAGRTGATRGAGNPAIASMNRGPLDASIGGEDVTKLLAQANITKAELDKSKRLQPKVAPLQATLQVQVKNEKVPAMNVVGVLPGSDPKLKDEYVVIGSHLDHLGRRGDTFFPGADDDGSGTTGVLAVSTMFAKNPVKPRRSILFVTFCGEEMGLIGSGYFVDHCPIPHASIAGELQMDMIGRDEEENAEGNRGEKAEDNRNSLHLIGTQKISRDLHAICMAKNDTAAFDLEWDEERMFARSDHANFARKGIPIAFFFTGLHRDYHQRTDTPDKIHYEKLLRVATYVYDIGFELARQDGRPLVDKELWETNRKGLRGDAVPAAPLRAEAQAADDGKGKEAAKEGGREQGK